MALALNGFWIYLGGLDVVHVHPRSALTACWYALVGAMCLVAAWWNRDTLRARLAAPGRLVWTYVLAGAAVAVWFLLNVALLSHGHVAHTFAGQLVLWTLPAAVLALSLPTAAVFDLGLAVGALAVAYLVVEIVALLHDPQTSRYSPIAELDPISAAQVPAIGAVALIALRTERAAWLRTLLAAALAAGAVLPGSRGPILALLIGVVVAIVLAPRRVQMATLTAVVVGGAVGYLGTRAIGSATYLTAGTGSSSSVPYSTIHIREEWWKSTLNEIPDAPIVGHGVAMLVDDTPEARRMGVAGERTYPHNSPLESVYSLGLIGAVPYFIMLVAGIAGVVAVGRRRPLVAGLYGFAFAAANVSGEIGADAALWAAGALAVGVASERAASRGPSPTPPSSSPS